MFKILITFFNFLPKLLYNLHSISIKKSTLAEILKFFFTCRGRKFSVNIFLTVNRDRQIC